MGHVHSIESFEITDDLFVVGPMARCCDDLELMLNLITGPEERQAPAISISLPSPRPELICDNGVASLRVALWTDEASCPVEVSIKDMIVNAAVSLQRAGAEIFFDLPKPVDFDKSTNIYFECLDFNMEFENSRKT